MTDDTEPPFVLPPIERAPAIPWWRPRCEGCGRFVAKGATGHKTWKEGGCPLEPDYAEYSVYLHDGCALPKGY